MSTTSKVTRLTKTDKVDSYGNSSFNVEFANGDKGFYSTKNPDTCKFIVGQEIEYVIEQKESKTGVKYFKVTLPQAEQFQKGGGYQKQDPKVQMISFAASYAKDLAVAGRIELKDLEATFERFHKMMTAKL